MTDETKKLIIHALSVYKGDDLYRAKAAFRGLSQREMNEQYGQSGKTRMANSQ